MTAAAAPFPVSPDSPHAHRVLALVWPLLRRAACRASRQRHMAPEDLLHHFAVHVLEHAHEFQFDDARHEPIAFAWVWVRRVLGTRFMVRWRLAEQWEHGLQLAHTVLSDPTGERLDDPAAVAELADDLAAMRRALEVLGRHYPRRLLAVELRCGLRGNPVTGERLRVALKLESNTADMLVRNGLKRLAEVMGADPERAGVSRGEGIGLGRRAGNKAKKYREAAA